MTDSISRQNPNRIHEAVEALKQLGLPRAQQNERSALTLLALLDLKPDTPWSQAGSPLRGITPIMDFAAEHYGKRYAPNTRETFRRFTMHQFIVAGLVIPNPDRPDRPVNSPRFVYQIEHSALELLRTFELPDWGDNLRAYLASVRTLTERYAQERRMQRIPVTIGPGDTISLSPGGQNVLVKKIIEEFAPRFTPGGTVLYVGDTEEKFAFFNREALSALGIAVDPHGKMPDVVIYHVNKNWLVLIEAVTSHGPVNPKRKEELEHLFRESNVSLIFITAFLDRRVMSVYLGEISWETDVWLADSPTHLIHFDGEKYLDLYSPQAER